jgi:hypothetical protein
MTADSAGPGHPDHGPTDLPKNPASKAGWSGRAGRAGKNHANSSEKNRALCVCPDGRRWAVGTHSLSY